MTDVDIVPHEAVEEPVEDKQSLQTPEGQREDEDEDTDTDDGAVGEDEEIHGRWIITISPSLIHHSERPPPSQDVKIAL